MPTNIKLQTAIHLALGLGAGAMALSFATDVVAQDADATDETIEEVVVTGSRIARADIDSASPITILSREDIEITGLTDVGSILQRMPSMSGSPVGTTTNNGNTGTGIVQVDLRGMGTDRTLTLINGMRTVDGGDYQAIPTMMIERIEILKDGASAVYGADAVAGVVNIITRRDFEGIEVSAQYADWFKTDNGEQGTFGLIAGSEFESGNVVFGAEYVNQTEAFQSDTPWDYFQGSYYIYPDSGVGCEDDPTTCYFIGSSRIPQSRLTFVNQGNFLIGEANTTPYEVGLMEPHDGRTYNYAPVNYMQTPYKRTNVFSEGHFDLTDSVRFNFEARGNFRESAQELAPAPYNSPTDPAYNGTFEGVAYSGISEDNYYLRRAVDRYNDATDSSLGYEPIRDARRRMIETRRRYEQEVTQFQWVASLEGTFGDYDWDVYVNNGKRSVDSRNFGQFFGPNLSNALGPSADMDGNGEPECYADIDDEATLIAGCVPFNFFGGGEVDPVTAQPTVETVTPDMVDYVVAQLIDSRITKGTQAGASITGSIWELPGGPLGWAAGYGYWNQEYTLARDSNKVLAQVSGNTGGNTHGKLVNNSGFLEVLAPVYDNGTQNLYLKGGVRYDDWNQFDGDWTWQLGVEFQALDSLKLRGTYGTIFRIPTISDLFGGVSDSFPNYNDPCAPSAGESLAPGCDRVAAQLDTQVLALVGGNPNLIPETGNTYTAGVVWTPQWGDHGLTTTVDYWQIDLDDGISQLGAQFILDDCYENLNEAACVLITRREIDYSVAQVLDGGLNVAEQGGKGVDTEIRWDYSSNIGQWQAGFIWSHLIKRTKTAFPGDDEEELQGRYTNKTSEDGGSYAKDKFNITLQWFYNDLSLGYLGEYISGLDADVTYIDYIQKIDSQMYHDLFGSYTWGRTTLSAGLTNITNKKPPYIDSGFNASTEPATYRMFGRGWYARVAWKF